MKYFITGRPFRYVPTSGLYFLVLGESIILLSNTLRQVWLGWPSGAIGWVLWALATAALLLLLLVVQAASREYWARADKPRPFWRPPNLLN